MGQKINPISFRLGVIHGWESSWYGGKDFAEKLVEDHKIRKFLFGRIQRGGISKIIIERTAKRITLTINTNRPGIIIGKSGSEVDKIKEEVKNLTKKDVQINIFEIKRAETDAKLVGENIAQQLAARISYRRAMKMAIQAGIRAGAQGIKIRCSGRLGGAEIARTEEYKEGRIPLHTLRADIDYALSEAQTVYGKIGIKVWIFKGERFGKQDLTPNAHLGNQQASVDGGRFGGRDDRRGGGRDDRRGGGGNDRGPRGAGGDNRGSSGPGGQNRGPGGGGGGGNRPGGGGGGFNNNRGGGGGGGPRR